MLGENLVEQVTKYVRRPGSNWRLRHVQAAALHELFVCGGLVGALQVGAGKTLVAELAPWFARASGRGQRPVLLVPGSLKKKTTRDRRVYNKQFYLLDASRYPIVSYEWLSRSGNAEKLWREYDPDMLVADEAHALKNRDASVTRKIARRLLQRPDTVFVPMSGTLLYASVLDIWHLCVWALRHGSPLPLLESVARTWADVLDDSDVALSAAPALQHIIDLQPKTRTAATRKEARDSFKHRLAATPGVILYSSRGCDASLEINVQVVHPPANIAMMLAELRKTWTTPWGDLCQEKVELWRHLREISCGYGYRWDPPPPEEWLRARRAWRRFVQTTLEQHLPEVDSPGAVQDAVLRAWDSRYKPGGPVVHTGSQTLNAWQAVKHLYNPDDHRKIEVYGFDHVLEQLKGMKRAVVFADHPPFGHHAANQLGWPYYQQNGVDPITRLPIEGEDGNRSILASLQANKAGRNLQAFSEAVVIGPPSRASVFEQLIGRLHRSGQKADHVRYTVLVCDRVDARAVAGAVREAKRLRETAGAQQKLLIADFTGHVEQTR